MQLEEHGHGLVLEQDQKHAELGAGGGGVYDHAAQEGLDRGEEEALLEVI